MTAVPPVKELVAFVRINAPAPDFVSAPDEVMASPERR